MHCHSIGDVTLLQLTAQHCALGVNIDSQREGRSTVVPARLSNDTDTRSDRKLLIQQWTQRGTHLKTVTKPSTKQTSKQ